MNFRFTPGQSDYPSTSTQGLRDAFLIEDLFEPGKVSLTATELDRAVVGGIVPLDAPLEITAAEELRCDYFFQRREGGVINVGGPGGVTVDDQTFAVGPGECVYIGRGSRRVEFSSVDAGSPAAFALLSYPAHREYPTTLARREDANRVDLGSNETANERTIYQYIHEGGIQSCQLVMGFTELKPGSVWNTMPCHTHLRRSEVYLYFKVDPAHQVVHLMGRPDETRPLWVKDRQAVLSPAWSIHSGVGTAHYSFIWAMGGENQRFDDMDGVPIRDLR